MLNQKIASEMYMGDMSDRVCEAGGVYFICQKDHLE